ncbi:MAG TPA: GNAT family N-acetyltransferase [Actinocrinis sp.]
MAPRNDGSAGGHVLDRSAWESLHGHHARFAERNGRAARYQPDVAPFAALEDSRDPRAWADLSELVGPGGRASLHGLSQWPDNWEPVVHAAAVQLVGADAGAGTAPTAPAARADPADPEAVPLGPGDVPEVLDLIARTEPGPFLERTIELGTYLGIRRDGALVAMAGERQHPPGWTEISAVCTDPAYRGRGLAGRLVRALVAGIAQRGETPFLNVRDSNPEAIRLYRALGFAPRRQTTFTILARR